MIGVLQVAFIALAGIQAVTAIPVASPCPAIQIISARGSTEAQGEGRLASLADAIQQGTSQTVGRSAVVFPASLFDYVASTATGVVNLKAQLAQQAVSCPNTKLVLLGYSAGAAVIGDTIGGGGGGNSGAATSPVAASLISKLAAVVIFGDPRHVDNESFQKGTDVNGGEGLYPRLPSESLEKFAPVLGSWCDNGDPFCASGDDVSVHLGYLNEYQDDMTQFVLGLIGN